MWNEQPARITLEGAQPETIGLWAWRTIEQADVFQVHTGLEESWRWRLRLKGAVEHDECEILVLL